MASRTRIFAIICTAAGWVLLTMLGLAILCLLLLMSLSIPINEGQEWSQLATAGILRGAV